MARVEPYDLVVRNGRATDLDDMRFVAALKTAQIARRKEVVS